MPDSVKYAFTLTLQSKYYKYKPEEQYDKTHLHVVTKLKALHTNIDIIAEITKNFNIHYHGVIQFKDINSKIYLIKEFYDAWRNDKYVGYTNIKVIEDEPGWYQYMIKDFNETKHAIDRPPVIYRDSQIIDNLLGNYDLIDAMCIFDLIDTQ